MKLIISNVPHHISTHGIKEMFRKHGVVKGVCRRGDVMEILMPNQSEAKKAKEAVNNTVLLGQVLKVRCEALLSTPKKHHKKGVR